jgi:hypothetical protein
MLDSFLNLRSLSHLFPNKVRRREAAVQRQASLPGTGFDQAKPYPLFFEDSLYPANCFLDFPGYFVALAFGFQVGVVRQSSYLLFNLTLHFVNLARNLILGTWLHVVVSLERRALG